MLSSGSRFLSYLQPQFLVSSSKNWKGAKQITIWEAYDSILLGLRKRKVQERWDTWPQWGPLLPPTPCQPTPCRVYWIVPTPTALSLFCPFLSHICKVWGNTSKGLAFNMHFPPFHSWIKWLASIWIQVCLMALRDWPLGAHFRSGRQGKDLCCSMDRLELGSHAGKRKTTLFFAISFAAFVLAMVLWKVQFCIQLFAYCCRGLTAFLYVYGF